MDEYIDAVRAQVCNQCPAQDEEGGCPLRIAGDCALNTYLSFVVDAIDELRVAPA